MPASPLILRPIAPSDAPALVALFHRLSPQEIRWRFLATLSELPHAQIHAWCAPDGNAHLAFVASMEGELHGVARAFVEPGGAVEFSLLVECAYAGRGLGRALMQRLTEALLDLGVHKMSAQVAVDNHRMQGFLRAQGFSCQSSSQGDAMLWTRDLKLPINRSSSLDVADLWGSTEFAQPELSFGT